MTQRPLSTFLTRLVWLCLIPLVLLAAGFAFYNTHRYIAEMRESADTLTSNVIAYVDHYLDSRIRALNMLAVSPLIDDPDRWDELYKEAKGYQESFNSHVILSDTASEDSPAQMLFNTREPFGTSLPAVPRPKGNSAAVQALKTGRPAVGDTFIGPVVNQKLVAIAVPAIRDGQITNLVISPLEAQQFQAHLDRMTLPEKWSLKLADGRGDVIAQSPTDQQREFNARYDEHFEARSGLSPWTVSLTIPSSAFTEAWLETGFGLILLVLIATSIGAFVGLNGGRRISRQVSSLAEAPGTALSSEFTEVADVQELLNSSLSDLQKSEARHRELFEVNPHPMWVYDLETLDFLEVNDAAIRQYGYSRDTFLSMTIKDIRPAEDIPRLLASVSAVSQGIDEAGQWRHRTCDGRTIDVEIKSHTLLFEGRRAELVLANNITERKQTQDALRASEAEFRTLVETMPQIVWVTRPDGWHTHFNQNWHDFTGLTLEESLGHGWNLPFHPEDRATAAEKWRWAIEEGKSYEIQYRLRRWDGIYRWMIGRALPVHDDDGHIVKWFGTCTDIDSLKRTQERLDEAQRIGQIGDWEYNLITQEITWSGEVYRILGRNPDLGPPSSLEENAELYDLQSTVVLQEKVDQAITSGEKQHYDLRAKDRDGKDVFVQAVAVPQKDDKGRVVKLVGTVQDITARKLAELALHSQARQQMLVAALGRLALSTKNLDDVYTEAANGVALGLDVKYCEILLLDGTHGGLVLKAGSGWAPGWMGRQVVTQADTSKIFHLLNSLEPIIVKDLDTDSRLIASELLVTHDVVSGINILVGGDESQLGVLGAYSDSDRKFTRDDISFLQGIANTLSAAIKRWRTEEKISYMAQHDSLTDLPNRLLLADRVHLAIAHAERSGGTGALLFIDLDRFKNVNDVFGHSVGDRVLQETAERLLINVRAEDTVCRQGGDEFIVVLPFIKEEQDAAQVANKLITAITTPFMFGGSEIILGASIGISCFPSDGRDIEMLLRNADAAMYVAKDLGRNRYQFYSAEMNIRSLDRLTLESDLHHAIAREELFVMYQPQQNLKTGKIVGFEALMRWRHPTRGLIPPGQFIPIAENSGLIVEIGTWMLEAACTQHAYWVSQGLTNGSIAVNVSSQQFRQTDFVDLVTKVLERSNLHPELLELEVTESVVMQALDEVLIKLEKLHALGIKLAIDDFGTGYSSLSYLKQFPLYRLKIDQSFIRGLPSDPESGAITEAIIKMGHSLGLDVLAEGLETEAQEKYLQSIACDTGQGYLYAKPLSVEESVKFLLLNSQSSI